MGDGFRHEHIIYSNVWKLWLISDDILYVCICVFVYAFLNALKWAKISWKKVISHIAPISV